MSIYVSTLVWQSDLPYTEQHILLALADHAWDDGSHVYPSIAYTRWKTNFKSERAVQMNLRRLEARNILVPVANVSGGRGRPTVYRINLDAIPLKPKYGPIEEYSAADAVKGATDAPIAKRPVKGASDDVKGASDDVKGASDDVKGASNAPETSLTVIEKKHHRNMGASLDFAKQKTAGGADAAPHFEPSAEHAAARPGTRQDSPPTPPIAPAPPPPAPASSAPAGLADEHERRLTWHRVLELEKAHYTPIQISQWLRPARLFERPTDGAYLVACRTAMQAEMVRTRFYGQVKMDLAAIVHAHVELEVVTL